MKNEHFTTEIELLYNFEKSKNVDDLINLKFIVTVFEDDSTIIASLN
jgi:hypothetical protein